MGPQRARRYCLPPSYVLSCTRAIRVLCVGPGADARAVVLVGARHLSACKHRRLCVGSCVLAWRLDTRAEQPRGCLPFREAEPRGTSGTSLGAMGYVRWFVRRPSLRGWPSLGSYLCSAGWPGHAAWLRALLYILCRARLRWRCRFSLCSPPRQLPFIHFSFTWLKHPPAFFSAATFLHCR